MSTDESGNADARTLAAVLERIAANGPEPVVMTEAEFPLLPKLVRMSKRYTFEHANLAALSHQGDRAAEARLREIVAHQRLIRQTVAHNLPLKRAHDKAKLARDEEQRRRDDDAKNEESLQRLAAELAKRLPAGDKPETPPLDKCSLACAMLIELTRDNRRTTLEEIAERVDVDPSTLRKSRRYARFREVWRGYKAKAPGKSDDSAE